MPHGCTAGMVTAVPFRPRSLYLHHLVEPKNPLSTFNIIAKCCTDSRKIKTCQTGRFLFTFRTTIQARSAVQVPDVSRRVPLPVGSHSHVTSRGYTSPLATQKVITIGVLLPYLSCHCCIMSLRVGKQHISARSSPGKPV